MPGDDFVVSGVSKDFRFFRDRVATYGDGASAIRMLLVSRGMAPRAALRITLHSRLHLMPTAARQLRHPEHEQVEIAQWAIGSSMPSQH